jgi:hypothetical protein
MAPELMKKKSMVAEMDKDQVKELYMKSQKKDEKKEPNVREDFSKAVSDKPLGLGKLRKLSEQCSTLHAKSFYSDNYKCTVFVI